MTAAQHQTIARAHTLMLRRGAWLDQKGDDYLLRLGADRRSRINMILDEAAFRALVQSPGLRTRQGGGWVARTAPGSARPSALPAGCPGHIEGERAITLADGQVVTRRANLGQSPIAWLARRKDQSGRPWLTQAQIAAGEHLRQEAEKALKGPSVTMRWDALPRSGTGSAARVETTEQSMAAAARVEAALTAVGPRLRGFVEHICIRETSLQTAEREHGLRPRQGKTLLKQGLQRLAEHYRFIPS